MPLLTMGPLTTKSADYCEDRRLGQLRVTWSVATVSNVVGGIRRVKLIEYAIAQMPEFVDGPFGPVLDYTSGASNLN
jgi:hypothetical protein